MNCFSWLAGWLSWLTGICWPRQPSAQQGSSWLYYYMAIAHECDTPILEALYHAQTVNFEQAVMLVHNQASAWFTKHGWRSVTNPFPANYYSTGNDQVLARWIKDYPSCNRYYDVKEQFQTNSYRFALYRAGRCVAWLEINRPTLRATSSNCPEFHLTKANLVRRLTELLEQ